MNLSCNIIRDLLPLYAEELASGDSQEAVKAHLDGCEDCRRTYEKMKESVALFGVPGIRDEFDTQTEHLLSPWLGEEAYMFHSPRQWRKLLGNHPDMEFVEVKELRCFESAWQDWLATENEFAKGDEAFWETIIKPCTNFVGMIVRKR